MDDTKPCIDGAQESLVFEMQDPIGAHVCRLCANHSERIIGIYSQEGVETDLANKMNRYLPVKVCESDNLPLQCCWTCASTVLAWHELVLSSVEAERRLKNLIAVKLDESLDGMPYDMQAADSSDGENRTVGNVDLNSPLDPLIKEGCFEEENSSHPLFLSETLKSEQTDEADCGDHYEDNEIKSEDSDRDNRKDTNSRRKQYSKVDKDAINEAKIEVDGRVYYNCKECGKSLHSPYTYLWHRRIHTGERPYVCDLCGKQFRVSQGLVRHTRETHQGIKKYPCDLCGRMFSSKRNVEEHRRIHTNERPYICDLCGKSFKQKASLFVHSRSHGDYRFTCSYCNQGFRAKGPLMVHITKHTGEKPYACEVCGRCFRIKYELKRHLLIHSDDKPFECSECGMKFRQKRYLKNHQRVNHPH